jgi:hypothetical protein
MLSSSEISLGMNNVKPLLQQCGNGAHREVFMACLRFTGTLIFYRMSLAKIQLN